MNKRTLENKVIVVAGGTGGIGRAVCRLLATHGATIVIASRSNDCLCGLICEIKKLNSECEAVETDLTSFAAWNKLVLEVQKRFRRIDVVVNCVGALVPGSLDALSEDAIQTVIQSNLMSVVYDCRAIIPIMRRQGYGHIINIGSLGGIVPMPHEALYSATKFAVRGLTLSLYQELRETGIHISLISPGSVRTKMLDLEATDKNSALSFVTNPLDPKDVAQAVVDAIRQPYMEVVLPQRSAKLSLILNLYPRIFIAMFRLLSLIGGRRLKSHRKETHRTALTVEALR